MSLYENGNRRDELIARIRNELKISRIDVSDEDLLKGAKDTFILNKIELGMSLSQLWKELKSVVGLE